MLFKNRAQARLSLIKSSQMDTINQLENSGPNSMLTLIQTAPFNATNEFVQTEPRAELGLSCLFRLRNLDSKSPVIFWLAEWVSEHLNSGKPRQMVT